MVEPTEMTGTTAAAVTEAVTVAIPEDSMLARLSRTPQLDSGGLLPEPPLAPQRPEVSRCWPEPPPTDCSYNQYHWWATSKRTSGYTPPPLAASSTAMQAFSSIILSWRGTDGDRREVGGFECMMSEKEIIMDHILTTVSSVLCAVSLLFPCRHTASFGFHSNENPFYDSY